MMKPFSVPTAALVVAAAAVLVQADDVQQPRSFHGYTVFRCSPQGRADLDFLRDLHDMGHTEDSLFEVSHSL